MMHTDENLPVTQIIGNKIKIPGDFELFMLCHVVVLTAVSNTYIYHMYLN